MEKLKQGKNLSLMEIDFSIPKSHKGKVRLDKISLGKIYFQKVVRLLEKLT